MHVIGGHVDVTFDLGNRSCRGSRFFVGSFVAFEPIGCSEGWSWESNWCTYSIVISPIKYFSTSPPGTESSPAGTLSDDWRREFRIDPRHSSASVHPRMRKRSTARYTRLALLSVSLTRPLLCELRDNDPEPLEKDDWYHSFRGLAHGLVEAAHLGSEHAVGI